MVLCVMKWNEEDIVPHNVTLKDYDIANAFEATHQMCKILYRKRQIHVHLLLVS